MKEIDRLLSPRPQYYRVVIMLAPTSVFSNGGVTNEKSTRYTLELALQVKERVSVINDTSAWKTTLGKYEFVALNN